MKRVIYIFENRIEEFDALDPVVLVRDPVDSLCVHVGARCGCCESISLRSDLCTRLHLCVLNGIRIRAHFASARRRARCRSRSSCWRLTTNGQRVRANSRLQIRELHRVQQRHHSPESAAKIHQNTE